MQNRRKFSLSVCAAAASAGAGLIPSAGIATERVERGVNLPSELKLRYVSEEDITRLPTAIGETTGRPGSGTLKGLIRWSGKGGLADLYDLTLPLPVENEDRTSLLNPTVSRQFRGADRIGSLYLSGDPAIIYIDEQYSLPDPDILAYESYSYSLPPRSEKVNFRLPSVSGLPVVGELFAKRSDLKLGLLIILTPSIVEVR